MKTKKDADKALKDLQDLAGSSIDQMVEAADLRSFITDVRDQLPDDEMPMGERRKAVEDAARRGFMGT